MAIVCSCWHPATLFSLSDAAAPREIKLRARKAAMPSSHATELGRHWQHRVRNDISRINLHVARLRRFGKPPMANVPILLTLPDPVRSHYRDRLRRRFPATTIELVDHHPKPGPYIGSADALVTFAPMLSSQVLESARQLKWIQALGTG